MTFDGTQPKLTQVPPIVPWPTSATRLPASAAVIEAENPAEPAPTTMRSYALFSFEQQSFMVQVTFVVGSVFGLARTR